MATFAVVGHPNKGKSSIVATLAENEHIAISPTPGTTNSAAHFNFKIDDQPLYALVDTPGFQRPAEVLDWLQTHAATASDRPAVVREFISTHAADPRFHDECELLRPIMDGAGILYVVDGAKPYGPEFEIEMQILQWTGQPRMALINLIGAGRYIDEWQRGLGQYFSIVRVFDAMHADFDARVNLLRAFAELNEDWRADMEAAINALHQEREHRLAASAAEIARALVDCLSYAEQMPLSDEDDREASSARLTEKLLQRVRKREMRARDVVQDLYRHDALKRSEATLALLDFDLFTREGWELFGLSRTQLLITGSMTGAMAGFGVDALLGGTTLLLGSGIGAAVGALGSWFAGDEIAKSKVLGSPLGGRILKVGPIRSDNFPWVFLGRAWLHHHLVRERNHALRETLSDDALAQTNVMDSVPERLRKELAKTLTRLRGEADSTELLTALTQQVVELLNNPLPEADRSQM